MYTMAIESRIRFITALFLFYKESQNFIFFKKVIKMFTIFSTKK